MRITRIGIAAAPYARQQPTLPAECARSVDQILRLLNVRAARFLTRATETSTSSLALTRNLPKIFWIFTASCWNTACPR